MHTRCLFNVWWVGYCEQLNNSEEAAAFHERPRPMLAVSLFSPERTETDVWITSHDLDDRDENLHLLYSDVLPRSVGTCEGWVDEDNFPGIGVGQIADFVEDVDCEEEEEDLQRFDDAFLDVVGNSCQVGMRRRWVGF